MLHFKEDVRMLHDGRVSESYILGGCQNVSFYRR